MTELEIRKRLIQLLLGKISLDVFEDWLVRESWNMHQAADKGTLDLVSALELRLAEHSSGHLTEEGLRQELRSFVQNYSATINIGPVRGFYISDSEADSQFRSAGILS